VTGVQDHQIGVLGRRGFGKPFGRKCVRHTTRIVDVHLAAERFDMNFALAVHAVKFMPLK
jgi:hypothetical protein